MNKFTFIQEEDNTKVVIETELGILKIITTEVSAEELEGYFVTDKENYGNEDYDFENSYFDILAVEFHAMYNTDTKIFLNDKFIYPVSSEDTSGSSGSINENTLVIYNGMKKTLKEISNEKR